MLSGKSSSQPAPSSRLHRWLIGMLAITVVLALAVKFLPLSDASARLESFPLKGDTYACRELPLEAAEAPIIGEARLKKFLCQTATQRISLSIIDGTRNRHAVHDPAYCMRGAGWQTISQHKVEIPGGHGLLLKLKKDNQLTEAVYWFSDGRNRHASPVNHWLKSAGRRLTAGRMGEAEVLVLATSSTEGTVQWSELWQQVPALWSL